MMPIGLNNGRASTSLMLNAPAHPHTLRMVLAWFSLNSEVMLVSTLWKNGARHLIRITDIGISYAWRREKIKFHTPPKLIRGIQLQA